MNLIAEYAVALLILLGATFALLGAVGLIRLPDFFCRLHGPGMITTLGVGSMALASALYFTLQDGSLSLREIACMLFLFITAPVTAQLLAKAALHLHGHDEQAQQEQL
jgi:multicomponent K+:H+ antiporter subunit G